MNVAQLIVRCLENEGVRRVYGIPGEETLALNQALADSSSIAFILTRHEQGAAFMANVEGRLTSFPGVCLATLGPGATNLLTGVADAQLDRAPLVAITGQVGLERAYKESHQYIDVVRLFSAVTKWSARIELADSAPEIVRKAFRLARMEKPGAIHVELPEDIAEQPSEKSAIPVRRTSYPIASVEAIARAVEVIEKAKHPVVLVGNGVVRRQAAGFGAVDALRDLLARAGLLATHTFMALGAVHSGNPSLLPPVGLQREGADLAALPALAAADVVIAVGYDLVEWAPAFWNPLRDKVIVHIDSTAAELDASYVPATEVVGEIGESLRALAELLPRRDAAPAPAPEMYVLERPDGFPLSPRRIVADLRRALGDEDLIVCDVGAHKVWLSRLYPANVPNTVIIANGFASMGIAVPGAIAAKLARPDRKVVAFCGDGGFLMNLQELETAKRLGAAIVVVVLVDGRLGVIDANMRRLYGRAVHVEFGNPDFVALAQSFGLSGHLVTSTDEFLPTLRRALDEVGPSLVAVPVDSTENANLGDTLTR